jgi:ubiquinone/menaquinone biosynthesis C-methylase UbiE
LSAAEVPEVSNPVFARFYAWMSAHGETEEQVAHRRELLSGAAGRVIEVGAGPGGNFGHYPATVTEVVAVEPEAYLRERAQRAASEAPVPVRVVDGVAERLPAAEGEFDVAVVSLVLCSVADQHAALTEIRRVLRPGGELRFYEHVRAREARVARVQHLVDGWLWPRLAGGCHTSRETGAAIERAGFVLERHRRLSVKPCPLAVPVAPHILGVARRP